MRDANLKSGRSSACANCKNLEKDSDVGVCPPEHRKRLKQKIYQAIDRCTNPLREAYFSYGGRGITVHGPWIEDKNAFLAYLVTLEGWDNPALSLDRMNNDLGYVPGNLRFATTAQQNANQRATMTAVPVQFFYEPKVILIARPQLNWDAIDSLLLGDYGQDDGFTISESRDNEAGWTVSPDTTDAEALCEFFGRGCYSAFGPAQGRVGAKDYFGHILEAGHGSVIENASFSFVIARGSRGLMAQMTRHRAGVAWAIESTHFIDYSLGARASLAGLPDLPGLRKHAEASVIRAITDYAKAWEMAQALTVKKKATAAAVRGLLPTSLESKMGFTANLRALRHIAELRGAPDNVPEIRMVAAQLAAIMKIEAPAIFQDMEIQEGADGFPTVISRHRKV